MILILLHNFHLSEWKVHMQMFADWGLSLSHLHSLFFSDIHTSIPLCRPSNVAYFSLFLSQFPLLMNCLLTAILPLRPFVIRPATSSFVRCLSSFFTLLKYTLQSMPIYVRFLEQPFRKQKSLEIFIDSAKKKWEQIICFCAARNKVPKDTI